MPSLIPAGQQQCTLGARCMWAGLAVAAPAAEVSENTRTGATEAIAAAPVMRGGSAAATCGQWSSQQ